MNHITQSLTASQIFEEDSKIIEVFSLATQPAIISVFMRIDSLARIDIKSLSTQKSSFAVEDNNVGVSSESLYLLKMSVIRNVSAFPSREQ